MAEGPNPQRNWFLGKYLPKVFIAYPHKPTVYTQLVPPENASEDSEVWRRFENEVVRLGQSAEAEVRAHDELVRRFADFLHSQSIAVAYDLLVRDLGVANIMRWSQKQIEDSDYLILVTTPSLCQFLDEKCPKDKEPLFSSNYLYNVIHSCPRNRDGNRLQMVPLFLSSVQNLDYVPMTLRGSTIYEVWDREYKEPLSEGMTSLLCRLTGQNRYQPPATEKQIFIPPRQPKFGPKSSSRKTGYPNSTPPTLSQNHCPLDMKTLSRLAEKGEFSRCWKQIAVHLCLSQADIERCEGWGGGDVNEACLQMLKMCAQQSGSSLTVATLSDAISKSGYHYLHSALQSVLAYSLLISAVPA